MSSKSWIRNNYLQFWHIEPSTEIYYTNPTIKSIGNKSVLSNYPTNSVSSRSYPLKVGSHQLWFPLLIWTTVLKGYMYRQKSHYAYLRFFPWHQYMMKGIYLSLCHPAGQTYPINIRMRLKKLGQVKGAIFHCNSDSKYELQMHQVQPHTFLAPSLYQMITYPKNAIITSVFNRISYW